MISFEKPVIVRRCSPVSTFQIFETLIGAGRSDGLSVVLPGDRKDVMRVAFQRTGHFARRDVEQPDRLVGRRRGDLATIGRKLDSQNGIAVDLAKVSHQSSTFDRKDFDLARSARRAAANRDRQAVLAKIECGNAIADDRRIIDRSNRSLEVPVDVSRPNRRSRRGR